MLTRIFAVINHIGGSLVMLYSVCNVFSLLDVHL